jgi:hypothetical protein
MHIVSYLIGGALLALTAFSAIFMLRELLTRTPVTRWLLFPLDVLLNAFDAIDWRPDHRTRLHVDSMERELRASTIELTPLGERFKAFINRRHEHARAIGDGFLSGEAGWLPAR